MKAGSSPSRTVFDVKKKAERAAELEAQSMEPEFWNDAMRARNISSELSRLKEEIAGVEKLKSLVADIKGLWDIVEAEALSAEIERAEEEIKKKEFELFFSGKYDRGAAVVSVYGGAGGKDAEDWAAMVLRMYERYAEKKGFRVKVLDEDRGEGGLGLKEATILVEGKYAYGLLKKEAGVHRLVRISPFSAQQLRHTSFASVEVVPDIEEGTVEIKPDDLKVDYYKASGPGGQYVNKRESAVRITHLPTGITVSCQSERLLGQNRERAMKILAGRLYQYEERKKAEELKGLKGERVSASWGNQIRSYVLHPYKLVKDLRTGVESSQPDKILDGELDKFIEEEVKL